MPSFTELNNKNFKDKFLLQWEGSDVRITESRLSAAGGGETKQSDHLQLRYDLGHQSMSHCPINSVTFDLY